MSVFGDFLIGRLSTYEATIDELRDECVRLRTELAKATTKPMPPMPGKRTITLTPDIVQCYLDTPKTSHVDTRSAVGQELCRLALAYLNLQTWPAKVHAQDDCPICIIQRVDGLAARLADLSWTDEEPAK